MRPGVKLAGFALVLAAAFGVGAVVGSAAAPIDVGGGDGHSEGHDGDTPTTTVLRPADHGDMG